MDTDASQSKSNVEKRLRELGKIAIELINSLETRKVYGKTISIADFYFILSQALQQVSLMNIIEIEVKRKRLNQKKTVT